MSDIRIYDIKSLCKKRDVVRRFREFYVLNPNRNFNPISDYRFDAGREISHYPPGRKSWDFYRLYSAVQTTKTLPKVACIYDFHSSTFKIADIEIAKVFIKPV